MNSNNMMSQARGEGPHSGHIFRRATSQDIRAFRWLSPTFFDMEEVFEDLVDQIHPETCKWIENSEEFGRWVRTEGAAVLGITGKTGCGKSILAAKITQLLKNSPQGEGNRPPSISCDYSIYNFYKQQLGPYYWDDLYNVPEPITYVFCNAVPVEERSVSGILSILLAQLCRQNSNLLEAVTMRMESSQTPFASLSDLVRVSEEDIARTIPAFYLILDGAEHLKDLLGFFLQLLSKSQNIFKILFLARDTLEIPNGCPMIEMSIEEAQNDRISIVSSLLERVMIGKTGQHYHKIAECLAQAEPSSILGPCVAANILEMCMTRPDFETILMNFPSHIQDLYALAFRQLMDVADPFQREVAVRCLSLLAVTQRPLDVRELQTALSISEGGSNFEFDERLLNLEAILLSTCSALISISQKTITGGMYSVYLTTVSFIHPSVSDFLFSQSPLATKFGLPLNRQLLHTAVARLCLVYLSLSQFAVADKRHQFQCGARHDSFPANGMGFLSYAGVYVFEHISMSGSTGQFDGPLLQDLQRFFKAHSNVKNWSRFISSCSPLAKLLSREENTDIMFNADLWLPGFGEKLLAWAENFCQNKNANFEPMLTGWHQEFITMEVLNARII